MLPPHDSTHDPDAAPLAHPPLVADGGALTALGAANAMTARRFEGAPGGSTARRRITGLIVALAGLGPLVVATLLEPAPGGVATHRQLGLAPCGFLLAFDTPCITCGMTTSFAHAVRGDLLTAAVTQPFGCLLALASAMAALIGLHVTVTGSRMLHVVPRLWFPRAGWVVGGLLALSWFYKMGSHRGLL